LKTPEQIHSELSKRFYELLELEADRGFVEKVSLEVPREMKEPLQEYFEKIVVPYVGIQISARTDAMLTLIAELIHSHGDS
jgi:hypothetical protein